MNPSVRAYRATHDHEHALTPALEALHHFGQSRRDEAVRDPAALRELAADVHLPVAAVRGALSSYSEVGHDPSAIRYCAGTSCSLCGGDAIAEAFRRDGAARPVYCLGYCDRAPAAMLPNGEVVADLTPRQCTAARRGEVPAAPPLMSIRSIARESIVTRRLLGPPSKAFPSYAGLKAALAMTPEAVTEAVITANLRGRGGAAFPTGRKWLLAAKAKGSPKYIVANGDEGDPGSFIDRVLMESDPHGILEGMAIAGHAVGATRGILFIRDEYPLAIDAMKKAIVFATAHGLLGPNALGPGRDFHVEVVRGLGSYVCGEETALLNAIEAGRGEVRPRPPFPVEEGLFGKPTVVVNVETLVNVPWIIVRGAEAFRKLGTPESPWHEGDLPEPRLRESRHRRGRVRPHPARAHRTTGVRWRRGQRRVARSGRPRWPDGEHRDAGPLGDAGLLQCDGSEADQPRPRGAGRDSRPGELGGDPAASPRLHAGRILRQVRPLPHGHDPRPRTRPRRPDRREHRDPSPHSRSHGRGEPLCVRTRDDRSGPHGA
jgi:NADH:ubiquinone oxidoreductase subunit E